MSIRAWAKTCVICWMKAQPKKKTIEAPLEVMVDKTIIKKKTPVKKIIVQHPNQKILRGVMN
jgi:hypothetical protein